MSDKFGWQKLARKEAAKRGRARPAKRHKQRVVGGKKPLGVSGQRKPGDTTLTFGKHKGQAIKRVPKEYLWWCLYHVQGLEPGLARDIVKVVGNGKRYASQRGWVMKPLTPPKQPPKQPGCQQWFWGRGSEYAGEVRQMDKHLHDISKECVGSGYVPFTGNPQELPFDVDLHQTQ